MKIGLDIHGVIDADPKYFVNLIKEIKRDGGEVYIITGHPKDIDLLNELNNCKVKYKLYDKILSIQDELDSRKVPVLGLDKYGRNRYDDETWDSCKAQFCDLYDIDIHIDDTFRYSKYFTKRTIFGLYDGEKIEYWLRMQPKNLLVGENNDIS